MRIGRKGWIAWVLSSLALSAPGMAQPTAACRTRGQAALEAWTQGRYDQMGKDFAPVMAAKLTPGALRQVWTQLQVRAGAFRKLGELESRTVAGHDVLLAPMDFADASLAAVIACDAQDRIDGFRVVPSGAPPPQATSPEPAVPGTVSRDLPVPSPLGSLPGTLTLPVGKGPFPAVLLLAGSGAHDRDETIGSNKPLRDIAIGLAKAGIASLRYDKRTYAYAPQMVGKSITIDDEVTDDALSAAHLLGTQPQIDPHRLFVLGHSLGAMMAPRIGKRDPQLAGLILMAAPARRIMDVIEQQVRQQLEKRGLSAAVVARAVRHVEAERRFLAQATPGQPAPKGKYGGMPQAYWLSWYRVDPAATAAALPVPMLILQGGSDFQVSPVDDFGRWKQVLAGKSGVAFHLYPGLSHLFMPAGKTGTIKDYQVPAHVAPQVIHDVAAWIEAQPPRP